MEIALKIYLSLLLLCMTSCFNNSQKSELSHDSGKLAIGRHPSYWSEVAPSYHEDLVKILYKRKDSKSEVNFVWKHPIIDRLQTWVNAMDSEARQTIWGKKYMAAIPKPKIVIIDDESPNAFVAPAFLEYSADIYIPGNNGTTEEVESIMFLNGRPNIFAIMLKLFVPFSSGDKKMLGDVVDRQKFAMEQIGVNCTPINIGQGKITFKGCHVGEDSPTVHGTEFLTKQTSNYVTLHMGLLRFMSEASTVAIIAHELGHYYRAHATDNNRLEGGFFFYEKDAANGKRPDAIKDVNINNGARQTLSLAAKRAPNALPGTKIDSEVLMALLKSWQHDKLTDYSDFKSSDFPGDVDENGFVPNFAIILRKCRANHSNKEDCDSLERILRSPAISSTLKVNAMPDRTSYLVLENAFLAATSDLKIGVVYGEKWTVDSENIFFMSAFLGDPKITSEGVGLACFEAFRATGQDLIPLRQQLTNCGAALEKNRKSVDYQINQLALKGIGWYTTEQEADEIGAELISSVGIDAKEMSNSLFDLFKYVNSRGSKTAKGVDYETCQKIAANNFGIGTGSVRSVSIGDWTDVHHDLCYRIFNSTRDSISHNYAANSSKLPKFDISWSELVSKLPPPRGNDKPRVLDNRFLVE